MAVESVAGSPWNGWPNQRGISGRMPVESVAGWAWNTQANIDFDGLGDFIAPGGSIDKAGKVVTGIECHSG